MKKHKSITILLMCMLLLVSVCAGILFGSVNIAFKDILNCLTGADRSSTSYILITTVRIPRLLGGLFAGIGLSCSGVILQGVMNNSLASPSTIGVNSGSGFAVMLAMIFFPANSFTLPVFAFCGALITTLLIFFLAALYGLMIRLAQPDKADFSVVVRVIAYSAAPCVFSIVPFVGSAVASVWCVAVSFAGCKYALGLSWGKTALALAPLFILGVAVLVQMSLLMRSML